MKRYLLLLIVLLIPFNVFASTEVYERTSDNLGVPKKIKYKNSMYNSVISTPLVNAKEKIYDFADLFTDSEEEEMMSKLSEYMNTTGYDIGVVTINSNQKNSTREYASDFYDYNDFKIDGLLYVIDMENREFYISTAGRAIIKYNDYIENILTTMDNNMLNHEYYSSVVSMLNELDYYYKNGHESTKYEIVDGVIYRRVPYAIIALISFVVAFIYVASLALRNKQVKLALTSDNYMDRKSIKITRKEDNFITSSTTKTYIPPSDSGGSSGGSFHSGSSGMSHGGGGHHF